MKVLSFVFLLSVLLPSYVQAQNADKIIADLAELALQTDALRNSTTEYKWPSNLIRGVVRAFPFFSTTKSYARLINRIYLPD